MVILLKSAGILVRASSRLSLALLAMVSAMISRARMEKGSSICTPISSIPSMKNVVKLQAGMAARCNCRETGMKDQT